MTIGRAMSAPAAALLLALAACGGGKGTGDALVFGDPGQPADVPDGGPGDPGPDGGRDLAGDPGTADAGPDLATDGLEPDAAADVPPADLPPADADPTDVPAGDPGATDPGTADPGTADPGVTDPGTADPGTADPGPVDAGGEVTGPEPWVQCSDDAPCKALFGEAATCNPLFPGGQCMGCDPEAPGVHVKCTQLSQQMDITLSCRFANGGVCLYDCPCPSWLRCLESESLCVLKPCTQDSECGPFRCLEIGDPGSNRYCLPPR